jgi:pimeloyl-ACP methyl ester carboxylesterase
MPYANNNGVRIYYQVEGKGPPLVLFQALGQVLQLWRTSGYVEALKDDYQMILMDPRGHGGSDKPRGVEAYRLDVMVTDVVAVMDDLGIDQAHYWGYSLGGVIGFLLPKYAPGRFHSLVLGGAAAPDGMKPEQVKGYLAYFDKGVDNYVADFEKALGPAWTSQLSDMYLQSDMEAFKAIAEASAERYDYRASLACSSLPFLVYLGAADGYYALGKEASTRIPEAILTFVSLPGLDHWSAIYRSDLVVPHVRKFLSEVGRAASPTEGESNVPIR